MSADLDKKSPADVNVFEAETELSRLASEIAAIFRGCATRMLPGEMISGTFREKRSKK